MIGKSSNSLKKSLKKVSNSAVKSFSKNDENTISSEISSTFMELKKRKNKFHKSSGKIRSKLNDINLNLSKLNTIKIPKNSVWTYDLIELIDDKKHKIVQQWFKLEKMRTWEVAPVDIVGCEHTAEKDVSEDLYRYQTLIGLIISSQTKDEITFETMNRLKQYGLTPEKIARSSVEDLAKILYGVSFHNNKANFLKELSNTLVNKLKNKMPSTIDDVKKFPGVGSKMGHLYMSTCFNENTGIAVDTHVHRICNRLKWVNSTKTPTHTMKELEEWVPNKLYNEVNNLLVGFGQTICKAVKPKCEMCLLNTECETGLERLNISKRGIKVIKTKDNKEKNSKKSKIMKINNKNFPSNDIINESKSNSISKSKSKSKSRSRSNSLNVINKSKSSKVRSDKIDINENDSLNNTRNKNNLRKKNSFVKFENFINNDNNHNSQINENKDRLNNNKDKMRNKIKIKYDI